MNSWCQCLCKHKQITSYLRDSVDTSRNSIMLEVHCLSKAWHHLTPNAVHFSLTFDNGEKTKIFACSVTHLYHISLRFYSKYIYSDFFEIQINARIINWKKLSLIRAWSIESLIKEISNFLHFMSRKSN